MSVTRSLSVVEICAGAGGQSLGLHRAGFEHELAVELDGQAAETLAHNLRRIQDREPSVRVGDVANPDVWVPAEHDGVDLLAGGVPCPPFSVAGKQLGSADERDLFAWAVELAGVMRPRALLLENVKGLAARRFAGYRQAVADRLDELGYWSEWRLLHASDFDVPQLRPRFVLVALPHEYAKHFVWPEPSPTGRTVGSELLDLMSARGWKHAGAWSEAANDIAPTIVGGSKKHGGADLGPTRARQAWAKLAVDGRGVANEAPGRESPTFKTTHPRLTNEMVARIQGWGTPGHAWEFLGRKTSVYRQIGNAFPPPVAHAVGKSIANALHKRVVARDVSDAAEHDGLYRLLRAAGRPVRQSDITRQLGVGEDELEKAIRLLSLDFDLEVGHGDEPTYSLHGFRAFRGEETHARHSAFASRASRSRVS